MRDIYKYVRKNLPHLKIAMSEGDFYAIPDLADIVEAWKDSLYCIECLECFSFSKRHEEEEICVSCFEKKNDN